MHKLTEITKNTQKAVEYFENKLAFTLGPVELHRMCETEANMIQIIDVRSVEHYNNGHIPGAVSISASNLEYSMDKLSKDKINIVYCYTQQCHLAARCAKMLAEEGFPVMELEGGFAEWKNSDYDIVVSG
jgi:rhodanese-related sulfurtransferase